MPKKKKKSSSAKKRKSTKKENSTSPNRKKTSSNKAKKLENPAVWKALYEKASAFRDLACWKKINDSQLFGVQNPHTGEIGYCCIMGMARQVFGLAVYLGSEGLASYWKMVDEANEEQMALLSEEEIPSLPPSSPLCLMASFESKGELESEDLHQIKSLGLKFRGKNSYPLFRHYQPGYVPWFLSEDQAEFLTLCLDQATEVGKKILKDPDLLELGEKGSEEIYLVRIPEDSENGYTWKDLWMNPAPMKKKILQTCSYNELQLIRVKKDQTKSRIPFEMGFYHSPTPVGSEDGPPFLPIFFLMVAPQSNQVLEPVVLPPSEFPQRLAEEFLTLLEESPVLPSEVRINQPELLTYLKPIFSELHISVKKVETLPCLEEFFGEFIGHLMGVDIQKLAEEFAKELGIEDP